MTFGEYISGSAEYRRNNPQQRLGQAYMNYLSIGATREDIADAVRGTYLDPFNNDNIVGEFLTFVMVRW